MTALGSAPPSSGFILGVHLSTTCAPTPAVPFPNDHAQLPASTQQTPAPTGPRHRSVKTFLRFSGLSDSINVCWVGGPTAEVKGLPPHVPSDTSGRGWCKSEPVIASQLPWVSKDL